MSPTIKLHKNDLPANVSFGGAVAIDTETLGLKPHRDRLCLVQLSAGDNTAHLVQLDGKDWSAPRLKALLADPAVLKIFHFGRFDIAMLAQHLGVMPSPSTAPRSPPSWRAPTPTATASRTCAPSSLGVDLSKQQQSSDWGADKLTDQQKHYAASDVLYLHALKAKLDAMLVREGRMEAAEACFRFLPTRAAPRPRRLRGQGHLRALSSEATFPASARRPVASAQQQAPFASRTPPATLRPARQQQPAPVASANTVMRPSSSAGFGRIKARPPYAAPGQAIGLLGGSFNPPARRAPHDQRGGPQAARPRQGLVDRLARQSAEAARGNGAACRSG